MHPLINIATMAARKAGDTIVRALDRLEQVNVTLKAKNDFVTDIDKLAEQEIIQIIHKAYPDHSILAEESGELSGNEYLWIIDPLDGTNNFVHGFPHFSVSIAIQHKGKTEHSVIYDPIRHELFSASRGAGARLNQYRMRVSQQTHLSDALIGTGFPYKSFDRLPQYLKMFEEFAKNTMGIRRAGSAALDLAYVAAGRLDGFWEFGLQPWDTAAGALMITEAGGFVTDITGGESYLSTGDVVAANPKIIRDMLKIINQF